MSCGVRSDELCAAEVMRQMFLLCDKDKLLASGQVSCRMGSSMDAAKYQSERGRQATDTSPLHLLRSILSRFEVI